MIIDIHAHPPRMGGSDVPPLSARESADLLLEQMEIAGVERCGLLGYDVAVGKQAAEVSEVNRFTAEVVALEPGRFFGMTFINPTLNIDVVEEELDRCLKSGAFLAVKLELDMNCRDERVVVVAKKAIEYNVPVLHHSWYLNLWSLGGINNRSQRFRSEPHDVAAFARCFPDLKIIMAHLEGSGVRGILDVVDCPNVWVDTSGSQPFSGTLEYGVKILGAERIFFGSDLCIRSYETQLGRVLGCPISSEERQAILRGNAMKLFGFGE